MNTRSNDLFYFGIKLLCVAIYFGVIAGCWYIVSVIPAFKSEPFVIQFMFAGMVVLPVVVTLLHAVTVGIPRHLAKRRFWARKRATAPR